MHKKVKTLLEKGEVLPIMESFYTIHGSYFAAYNTEGILQFSHGFETC